MNDNELNILILTIYVFHKSKIQINDKLEFNMSRFGPSNNKLQKYACKHEANNKFVCNLYLLLNVLMTNLNFMFRLNNQNYKKSKQIM